MRTKVDVTTRQCSKAEIKTALDCLMEVNPDFKDNPEAVCKKIRELDEMADDFLEKSKTVPDPELETAIALLLWARNVMARLIEGKEREMPNPDPGLSQPETMKIPDRDMVVAVVDDSGEEVSALLAVLREWPRVKPVFVFVSPAQSDVDSIVYQIIRNAASVVLLDEALGGGITGTVVQSRLRQRAIGVTVASITGGGKPEWAEHHFAEKVHMDRRGRSNFIRFFNRFIHES